MKSTTRVIALLVGLLLGMFLLTGSDCNKSSEPGTASLIGTWKLTQMTVKGTPLGDMTMTEATPGFPNMSITVNEHQRGPVYHHRRWNIGDPHLFP